VLVWIAPLIVAAAVAAAIAGRLFVRSRMPQAGWFVDSSRADTYMAVLGTMFAVMLAFVILFSLQSYQHAREGASREAVAVAELHVIADVLGGESGGGLHGDLNCYARAVISDEWPAMRAGTSSQVVQSWVDTMGHDFAAVNPVGAKQEVAYAHWFDEQAPRREGRRARLAEATPSVPLPMWIVLGIGATAIIAYMCAQADRREPALIQAIPIGLVAALVAAGLLVVFFLDHPYANWSGSIGPTEMQRSLATIEEGHPTPCDERGFPTS
jgi:hypothetical protein